MTSVTPTMTFVNPLWHLSLTCYNTCDTCHPPWHLSLPPPWHLYHVTHRDTCHSPHYDTWDTCHPSWHLSPHYDTWDTCHPPWHLSLTPLWHMWHLSPIMTPVTPFNQSINRTCNALNCRKANRRRESKAPTMTSVTHPTMHLSLTPPWQWQLTLPWHLTNIMTTVTLTCPTMTLKAHHDTRNSPRYL